MRLPRKLVGIVLTVGIVGAAGAGIWLRLRPGDAATAGENAEAAGDAPDNSAADAFSTDVPIPVEGAQVIRGDLVLEVRASGQAAASQGATIRALVGGQVKAVPVRDNTPVAASALLVLIDSTENRLALDEARARLDRAMSTFRELTIGDDRITDVQIRSERERAARIKAGIDEAEVQVRRAQLALERSRVTAPFGGRVASVRVVPGQQVNVGDELLTVVDLDPIRVEVQVLESEVGHLRAGGSAAVIFAAFPGETFTGRIETINPLVDQNTRQAKVTVVVPNRDGRILPGMYASVVLDARRLPDRILVPRSAILERDVDRRTMLFVFSGQGTDGVAEWRYVTPGLGNSKYVEIVANPETGMVEPGEIVLVSGHYTLTHGARVRLTENAAAEGGRPR